MAPAWWCTAPPQAPPSAPPGPQAALPQAESRAGTPAGLDAPRPSAPPSAPSSSRRGPHLLLAAQPVVPPGSWQRSSAQPPHPSQGLGDQLPQKGPDNRAVDWIDAERLARFGTGGKLGRCDAGRQCHPGAGRPAAHSSDWVSTYRRLQASPDATCNAGRCNHTLRRSTGLQSTSPCITCLGFALYYSRHAPPEHSLHCISAGVGCLG